MGRLKDRFRPQRRRFSVQFSSNVSGVLAFSCGSPSKILLPSRVTSIKRELARDRPPSSRRGAPCNSVEFRKLLQRTEGKVLAKFCARGECHPSAQLWPERSKLQEMS
jgi:hypothetical protein